MKKPCLRLNHNAPSRQKCWHWQKALWGPLVGRRSLAAAHPLHSMARSHSRRREARRSSCHAKRKKGKSLAFGRSGPRAWRNTGSSPSCLCPKGSDSLGHVLIKVRPRGSSSLLGSHPGPRHRDMKRRQRHCPDPLRTRGLAVSKVLDVFDVERPMRRVLLDHAEETSNGCSSPHHNSHGDSRRLTATDEPLESHVALLGLTLHRGAAALPAADEILHLPDGMSH